LILAEGAEKSLVVIPHRSEENTGIREALVAFPTWEVRGHRNISIGT
jgi:hypothetical protein